MDEDDSKAFRKFMNAKQVDQEQVGKLVRKSLTKNQDLIWNEALVRYGLLE